MTSAIRNNNRVLRECSFVLPERNPMGEYVEGVHEELETLLVKEFGGFRVHVAEDIFLDTQTELLVHDDTVVYTLLIEDTAMYLEKAKKIAINTAFELEQDFVCFTQPNGEVYFLDVQE